MEKAISSLRTTNTAYMNQIKQLIASTAQSPQSSSLCSALLMQQLHYRDVIDHIEKTKSNDVQRDCLRYTLQEDNGDVFVEMLDLRIPYGFVYHNPSRCQLILSPLTDRYFHALFTAMRSFQSTNLSGPTLSGKSTLICMLGRALGRDVLQKFCTALTRQNELEQLMTGSLLLSCSLLLKNVEVLSSPILHFLTSTISTITSNAMIKKHFIELNQRELHFSSGFQIVLTSTQSNLSAAPAHYSELLERTISLPLIPLHLDIAIYSLLYSYSFENATLLARKLYYIWSELSAVISREDPTLSFLGMLHSAIDCILPMLPERLTNSDANEAQLLQLAAMNFFSREIQPRSSTIYNHMIIFTKALWFMDYIPRAAKQCPEQTRYADNFSAQGDSLFTEYLTEAYDKANCILNRYATEQSLRLAQSLSSNRSTIVCGASKSGKTTIVQLLASAFNILYPKCYEAFPELVPSIEYTFVTIKKIVPSALTLERLYGGYCDSDTSILKQMMHSPVGRSNFQAISPCYIAPTLPDYLKTLLGFNLRTWICLDGALDMTWIEYLLSLTARNDSTSLGMHQLPLSSAPTTCDPNISIIFETIDLGSVSPSFLSHCGHIVMNALPPPFDSEINAPGLHHLVLQGYVKSLKIKPGTPALVIDICSKHLLDMSFIDTLLDVQVATSNKLTPVHFIQNFLTLLQAMGTSSAGISYQVINQLKENEKLEYQNKVELVLMWCLAWGFGSTLKMPTKRLLSSVLETHFSHLESSWASNGPQCSIFDCILDVQHNILRRCKDHLPTPNITTDTPMFSVFIPRISTTLAQIVAKQAIRCSAPVLIYGERDAGATTCTIDFLQRLSCFSSRGFTTIDGTLSNGINSKSEDKCRISNMRMATTLIISSMASKMKRKLHLTTKDTKNTPQLAHEVTMGYIDGGNVVPTLIPLYKSSTSEYIEGAVQQVMQRERRNILEPPPGKVIALFFDDLHLPISKFPSPQGTIRSLIELHQLFKQNEVEPQNVENAVVIATASSESEFLSYTKENTPAARLLSRFFPVHIEKMQANELYHVFHPVLTQHFERQDAPVRYGLDIRQQLGVVLAISIDMFFNLQRQIASFTFSHLLHFFQHLLLPTASALPTLDIFIRLWRHESYRVFFDANTSADVADELNNSYAILRERTGITSYPNEPLWSYCPFNLIKTEVPLEKQVEAKTLARRQNSSSLIPTLENTTPSIDDECLLPIYDELASGKDFAEYDHSKLQSLLEPLLPKDFTLATSFIAPLFQICRLLGSPSSRFVLSGCPGQGKGKLAEAAAKLMTHSIVHYECIADRDPGLNMWRKTLKEVVHGAGVLQQDITLIIKHPDTFSDQQLADLVCIMQRREVPMLFTNDEQEEMSRKVKDDKLSVMTAKHDAERKTLLSTMLAEKDLEIRKAAKSESVRDTDLEQLDRRHDAKIQLALEAIINVQHGETDDLLRQFEANVDVNIAIGLSVAKPVGVLTGIWNDIIHAMSKNLRVVVCVNDIATLISRAPKLKSTCQFISTNFLYSSPSLKPIFGLSFESAISTAIENKSLSKDIIELVQDNLDILGTIGVICHTSACEIAARHSEISSITLHHIQRFARIYFKMLEHFRARIDQATASPRSFLKAIEMIQAEVFNAKDKERGILAEIEAKTNAINAQKVQLTSIQAKADQIRSGMRQRKDDVDTQVAITNEIERMTQHEMKGVMKILDDANAAVASLDKRYIIEIKSFIHPPSLVHMTLNAICVVYSIEPSWENARRLLGDTNFINTMLNYDKDNVSEETLEKLVPFFENPLFTQNEVEKQSVAASIMISWITAINTYCNVRKIIKPKLDILESAHTKLKSLVSDFTQCKTDLDAADKLTSDIELEIQSDMHAKKDLLSQVEEVQYLLGKGSSAILQLASESSSVTQYLDSMIEYDSFIVVEAALASALMVYATGFGSIFYDELLDSWKRELAESEFSHRFNHPKSILNDIAKHPFGVWLYSVGLFHSKLHQTAAYTIAYSIPILVISNYSNEVESMIMSIFDTLNIEDPMIWEISDKDFKTTFDSCKVLGRPLLVKNLDYSSLISDFGDILELSTNSGTEQLSLKEDGIPLHPSFRLILTSSGTLDKIHTTSPCLHINAKVFTESFEIMLVDDMCRANVSNSSRQRMTSIVNALEASRKQLRKAQTNLIEHIQEILSSMKFPTEELDKLKELCLHNVQTRQDIAKLETDIEVTLAHYRGRSCRQLASNGSNFFTALSLQSFTSVNFSGFRKLFIYAQANAINEWMTPKKLLAQIMSNLARSIPFNKISEFAWLLTLQLFTNAPSIYSTTYNQVSHNLSDSTRLQLEMFLPSALASATTPDMVKLIQRCTSEDLLVGLQVLQPIAKRRRAYPEYHEHIDLVVAYLNSTNPTLHQLCFILKALLPKKQYEALCAQFVSDTLDEEITECYKQNVNMPEWGHALLTPTAQILPFGIQTCTLHGSLGFLKNLLDTVLSMRMQVKVLHSLLQRPQVGPLLRWKLPHHDRINNKYLISLSSLQELDEVDEITPNLLSQFAWSCVYLSVVQQLPEYLNKYTPLTTPSTTPEINKPVIHIWAFNGSIPKPLESLCMVVNPMGLSTFAQAIRDTLLALVSIPFSPQIAETLQSSSLDDASKTTIGILMWRLLSGLTFFHAVLLVRQENTFGSLVDHYPFDIDDITLSVMELVGPLIKYLIRSYSQHNDSNSYNNVDWIRIRSHIFDHVYSRKLKTQRIRQLIFHLLEECVNYHLVEDSLDPSLLSKFHLPLYQFFSLFQDVNVTTAEDYLRILCEFASTTEITFRDVPINKKSACYDIHTVLLKTDASIQVKVVNGFGAFVQSILDQMPSSFVLKLHPRNAVKLTPLRQLLKSLLQQHQTDRESFVGQLKALIPRMKWENLSSCIQKRVIQVLNDELPASLAMKSLASCGVGLSEYLSLLQQQSAFLQAWWDEEHIEYWCPSIIGINELVSTFLITYGVQFNRDTSQLSTIFEVYPSQASLPDATRHRDELLVLSGLTLVNGTPMPISVKEFPGKQVAIKLVVRVLETKSIDYHNDYIDCPVLQSSMDPSIVASIPLRIVPSIAKWSSCLYLFISR
ncbi:hypothetical protein THRCLA_04032 [Thraustotheca clavata]|uniref:Dynein heavy chain n=1 Tax=Thraustotheca clavata TaxID=74557 RepID=A0A1W0A029_9STRA|nr:hypothetical protein THRCLA_04032 [Thraustotheca clavata]